MSNSNYAYYPFPTTPTRSSASSRSGQTSRESSPQISYSRVPNSQQQQPPRTPTRSGKMAPSPAAGRQQQQQAQSQAPKTPTKLQPKKPQGSNTPGSGTPQKLNQPASGKGAPNTPRSVSGKKPAIGNTPSSTSTSKPKNAAQGAASTPKGAAQGKAEETAARGQQAADDATSQAQSTVGVGDDDDEPMSKVTQAAGAGKDGLEQAAPEPIKDDEDQESGGKLEEEEDATGGAKDDDEEEEDVADDATEKAGQMGESTDDATTEENEGQQEEQGQQGGKLLKGAQGLAGKASGLAGKGAGKAQESVGNASGKAQDTAGSAQTAAGKATNNAQKATQDPTGAAKDTAEDAKKGAEDVADNTQATAQEGLDEAQKVAGEATDEVGDAAQDAADGAQEGAKDVKQSVEDTTDGAQDAAQDAAEGAQDAAGDATEGAQDAADGVKDTVEDTAEGIQPPEGLPLDLSILKGLEVQSDGSVVDAEGNHIGRLAEGDAEDLEGYPIGDNGEILDDDGDLVGRVELLPDQIKQQIRDAKDQGVDLPEGADEYLDQLEDAGQEATGPAMPGLNIMEGLTCGVDGLIYDTEGNTIGRVTDGDADQLQHATLNDQGEFLDEEGNVVGYADLHEEAADLVEQGIYPAAQQAADQAQDQVEGAADQAEDAADRAEDAADEAQEQAQEIEDQLPGIEALQGKELNETGDIVDDQGDVLGHIEDEELRQKIADGEIDPNTLKIDEEGQVVDEDGNVLGKTELAEGAAEKLAGGPLLDPRILEGKKINKKGSILDEDGEQIGELRDGDLKDCAGLKVNDRGEVLDKKGKIVGHASVVPGEAAENATRELLEELGELQPQTWPDLSILDGFKVNKKGQVLNEDGEPIGELIEGELSQCAGKKCNDQGEVLDKEGNVIGRVQNIPEHDKEEEEQAEEQQEEQNEAGEEQEGEQQEGEEEEEGQQLPPLSTLEGLTVNKSGKLIDSNGTVVGELVEGDPKKLSKSGSTCDAEGQFWDNKGHVIGRAQTVPIEDPDEEAIFAGLEGLHVVENGYIQDENGNTVGYVTEGDPKRLIGRVVDEDGDILDKKGSVVGHADRYDEPEVEEEQFEEADLSFLQGKTVNKAGVVIGDDEVPIARLIEGKPKELAGKQLDGQGQIWNNQGQVIGRVELIPEEEREGKAEGPFGGLEGLRVIEGGKVADDDGNVVGEIVEGNAKRLLGMAVDEDGDILDKYGNVKGHAEPLPEEEEEAPVDNSLLDGKQLNKQGYVVNEEGVPFGRLVEGNVSELAGRRCDENGYLYNDTGKVVGRCEVIPENERVSRPEGAFAGLEGLRVVKDGKVEDEDGNVVGEIVEGNAKRLVGMAVDEDGDILDKYGNVKGHAEPYEEPEPEEEQPEDLSALAGCTINKSGNAVDGNGTVIGRVSEGDLKTMIGKKVDGEGQIWDNAGNVVGRCALVYGEDTSPEGPFAGFEGLQIKKDGTVVTAGDDIVGRVIEGDIKKLLGHTVDEDGDIVDKNGNSIGKAERWEPEEKERRVNPMSGMRVNKEGEVRDDNGDLVGRLTQGDLGHCVGQEIDDSGNVVDVDGNKIGEVTLLENIAEDEYEGPSEEELEEARKREDERKIAEKMSAICTQTLERMQPICKQIKDHMEKADRTPKDELDEEELVNNVKPLIEEGGRILQECNGSLRGLDPDGKIAAQAKGRAGTGEATPEEYRLAETLKELTTTVVTTIDDAKKKLNDMPHAKKKLNPLWGLMTQPLFQILAAVGLLLAGVLGLVGQLLNALGLGGLVNGLLGGLGIDKLMSSLGFGGGDKKKGKGGNPLGSLPIVGGFLGGDKK